MFFSPSLATKYFPGMKGTCCALRSLSPEFGFGCVACREDLAFSSYGEVGRGSGRVVSAVDHIVKPVRMSNWSCCSTRLQVSETRQMQAPWTTCEVGGGDRRSGRKQRLSTSRDVAGDGMPRSFRQSQGGGAALWQMNGPAGLS